MKKNKAIEELKHQISTWKGSYLKLAEEMGGGEFLCDDFKEEIYEFASPYVENLYRMKMIDREELVDFINFCEIQIAELSDLVKEEDQYA